MGEIIDLTEQQGHEILTTTESDGLFGGKYLADQPLGSYLEATEQPKYVLRNKKSGLTITGEQDRTLEPDTDFQMFGLVTDLRVVFVAGQGGGDRSISLELGDIVEANVESGLRRSTLSLVTLDDETWTFPCQGDPSPVATYLEDAAQLWANAARLLDELETALERVRNHLDSGEHNQARDVLAGSHETLDTALDRAAEIGPSATDRIGERGGDLRDRLEDLERELAAGMAGRAHSRAQKRWSEGAYEAAADEYDDAIETYQSALKLDGSVPDDDSLRSRLAGVAGEREILRVGPLVDADTARRYASALADPEEAAEQWQVALDRYRELLGLEWGTSDREFVADRDLIRDQTTEIADDAIGDHYEAGRQWLSSGDKLAVQDRNQQATQVYERARDQFEHAHCLASEVQPDRLDTVETGLTAAKGRLDGDRPTEQVPADPVEFDPDDVTHDSTADPDTPEKPEGIEGLSFHDSGTESARSNQAAGHTSDPSRPSKLNRGQSGSDSVLDRIQAQKGITTASESSTANEPETTDSPQDSSDSDATDEQGDVNRRAQSEGDEDATAAPSSGAAGERTVSDEQLSSALDALDRDALRKLVGEVWAAEGWMTTLFDDEQTVYDVVAIEESSEKRLLLWAVDVDRTVERSTIRQCRTTVENSHGSDGAVVVTTGAVTPGAKTAVEGSNIDIVETTALLERVRAAGLAGTVCESDSKESPQT